MVAGVELLVECCPSFRGTTTAVLVLAAGVRLHHHWSGHRSVVGVGRCRIWRSQCQCEFLPQVEDDNILKVVDVLLLRVNSWGIYPLHETAIISLFGVLQKP
jgi:hypothetical protein